MKKNSCIDLIESKMRAKIRARNLFSFLDNVCEYFFLSEAEDIKMKLKTRHNE